MSCVHNRLIACYICWYRFKHFQTHWSSTFTHRKEYLDLTAKCSILPARILAKSSLSQSCGPPGRWLEKSSWFSMILAKGHERSREVTSFNTYFIYWYYIERKCCWYWFLSGQLSEVNQIRSHMEHTKTPSANLINLIAAGPLERSMGVTSAKITLLLF